MASAQAQAREVVLLVPRIAADLTPDERADFGAALIEMGRRMRAEPPPAEPSEDAPLAPGTYLVAPTSCICGFPMPWDYWHLNREIPYVCVHTDCGREWQYVSPTRARLGRPAPAAAKEAPRAP